MLRVSKITDYGIVILSHLALQPGGATLNARELAGEAHLPLPVVSKTLKILAREGLLESQRGAKGGYTLSRQPEAITLAEVITALEGPIGLIECSVALGQCAQEETCQVRGPWQRVNQAIRRALETVTLAELLPPANGRGTETDLLPMRIHPGAGST